MFLTTMKDSFSLCHHLRILALWVVNTLLLPLIFSLLRVCITMIKRNSEAGKEEKCPASEENSNCKYCEPCKDEQRSGNENGKGNDELDTILESFMERVEECLFSQRNRHKKCLCDS